MLTHTFIVEWLIQTRGTFLVNNFWVRLASITTVILMLYYLMSPYQQCMRSQESYSNYVKKNEYPNLEGLSHDEHNRVQGNYCRRDTSW